MTQLKLALSFKEAIAMGKYEEEFLNQYDEWKNLDEHIRYQFIIAAIGNRRTQLRQQWAGLANQLDFSKKPHLKEAQKKVEEAMRFLNNEEERLRVEYAGR
jgi:hypothetical protein